MTRTINEYPFTEWVLYDEGCPRCANYARRFVRTLNDKGVGLIPLQSDFAKVHTKQLADPLKEMLLITAEDDVIGGADAFIYLSRKIWWAYGFYALAKIPGLRSLYRALYAHIARNRHCL